MKRSLPVLLLLLAPLFLPSAAQAYGIRLAWNNCFSGPGATAQMPFLCSDDVTVHRLVGSFIPPDGITQLVGESFVLDFMFSEGPIPDWWMVNSGQCRYGSLGVQYAFTGLSGCSNYWGTSLVGGFTFTEGVSGNPSGARLEGSAARPATGAGPVSSSNEYYAFQVVITSEHTTAADPPACAGCEQPACILLEQMTLYQPPGVGDVQIGGGFFNEDFASWQCAYASIADPGGILVCSSVGCPVPAMRQTWGRVRSLYR